MRLWLHSPDKRQKSAPAHRLVALSLALLLTLGGLMAGAEEEEHSLDLATPVPAATAAAQVTESAKPADDSYFEDAVLVGDSLSEGFRLSRAIPTLNVLSKIGQSARGILKNRVYKLDGKKLTLKEWLEVKQPRKLYLWVGSNGIDTGTVKAVANDYAEMLDMLTSAFPDMTIYCLASAPIIEARAQKQYPKFTNKKVRELNDEIARIAGEKGCHYLAIDTDLWNDSNRLNKDYSAGDGIHMVKKGYQVIADYLRLHTADNKEVTTHE